MMANAETKVDEEHKTVPGVPERDIEMGDGTGNNSDSDESSSLHAFIFKIINYNVPEEISVIKDMSNLTALRLFNDLDIRPSPTLPTGTKRILNPHPLIDQDGLQEIYTGKNIWIYDSQSNFDQCVRVVNQTGAFYGTAT